MNDVDIDRAKQIGLQHVRDWLPDGRIKGREWVALNPTRHDANYGSFSVNLDNGKWADFRDDDAKGKDAVSLYYYLNSFEVETAEASQNYKNHQGGLMVEAAKCILLAHDPSCFPGDFDNEIPKSITKDKGNFWDGWRPVEKGMADPPEMDLTWYIEQWGELVNKWFFTVNRGKKEFTVMAVVRFRETTGKKKKADRPFTIWTDGKIYRWRAKAPDFLYPLWNVSELELYMNRPVVLTEGQKKSAMLKPVIGDEYVCVGWYGGAGNTQLTDWEPLRGREVWFPFDADVAGRTATKKIKEIAKELDIILHIVHTPLNVKKGWNLDDAIDSEWSRKEIIKYLNNKPSDIDNEESEFLDDDTAYKFKILGYCGDNIAFYPFGSKHVAKFKASSLNKGMLMTLMDRSEWGNYYRKDEGGCAWESAVNDILRRAEDLPIFDPSCVRKTGAWKEGEAVVINTGEYLIINGKRLELFERNGQYIYERGNYLPYATETALETVESKKLIDMLDQIPWGHKSHKYILSGWMILAAFGGALDWRPNVWLQGRKGSGKSWILEHITRPLITQLYGVKGKGTSSPAGIRQNLENSTKPVELDEMESSNKKNEENIEQILTIFREGSSGGEFTAATLHGTSDGEGKSWLVQSMTLFASIGSRLTQSADRSRFSLITIENSNLSIEEREEKFKILQELVRVITPSWAKAFNSRTYAKFSEIQKCIKIMIGQASDILGNRRDGDQMGTLMAGAYMVENDNAPSAAEALKYLEDMEIQEMQIEANDKGDEELLLDEILTSRIELNDGERRYKVTIGLCLHFWFATKTNMVFGDPDSFDFPCANTTTIKNELAQYGIKPNDYGGKSYVQIATHHPAIIKLLRETAWANIYSDMLGRLSYCEKNLKGPGNFAGVMKRFRQLDAEKIFDQPPF